MLSVNVFATMFLVGVHVALAFADPAMASPRKNATNNGYAGLIAPKEWKE